VNFYIILVKLKLNEDEDIIGEFFFSVKSMYDGLTCNEAGSSYKYIWKGKVPTKIKIFTWLIGE